jgi:hypothetical protein
LYLLRRDINSCLEHGILFPGAMGILVGIDLLGKFLSGNDLRREVGDRFKNFVSEYFDLVPSNVEVVYQLRNSLLHSFGLRSPKCQLRIVASGSDPMLIESFPAVFTPDLIRLHQRFEQAIADYRVRLLADSELEKGFTVHGHVPKYGALDNR